MHSLAHYALLGSLITGAAGALVLATVTVKYGIKRREAAGEDQAPEDTARRQRRIRVADTAAVLCFAVAAGLGVVGLMQQTRAVTPAIAATDDGALGERLQALEKRVANAELELQARSGGVSAHEWRAWEERIARLESRLGAVEGRAAVAERRDERPRTAPAATPRAPRPAAPPKAMPVPPPAPAPSASPRAAPESFTATTPDVAAAPPAPEPSASGATTAADPSLAQQVRRDWDAIKRQARRGGDEWRDGWDQLKRLFGY